MYICSLYILNTVCFEERHIVHGWNCNLHIVREYLKRAPNCKAVYQFQTETNTGLDTCMATSCATHREKKNTKQHQGTVSHRFLYNVQFQWERFSFITGAPDISPATSGFCICTFLFYCPSTPHAQVATSYARIANTTLKSHTLHACTCTNMYMHKHVYVLYTCMLTISGCTCVSAQRKFLQCSIYQGAAWLCTLYLYNHLEYRDYGTTLYSHQITRYVCPVLPSSVQGFYVFDPYPHHSCPRDSLW